MENIGNNVSRELNKQGDQIKTMNDQVFQMNSEIDSSETLVAKMMKRQHRNKMILVLSSILFVIIFIILILLKFIYDAFK
jgi:t-SNARE complex subunit (syntaxin)